MSVVVANNGAKDMSDNLKKTTTLKQHHFTPTEAQVPVYKETKSAKTHQGSLILDYRRQKLLSLVNDSNETDGKNQCRQLDGFCLLENTGAAFPEDVLQASLADQNLRKTEPQDFIYFTELQSIDVSENLLDMAPFGGFPKLRDLKIACNNIMNVDDNMLGFNQLLSLDLSYNKLTLNSVQYLDHLPNLRDLDLCGNNLGSLPSEMSRFRKLEKILLDHNQLDNGKVLMALCDIPNLRHVSLANNFFSYFPKNAFASGNFKYLEILDLSFNYIGAEDQLEPLIYLPRLLTLFIYGNPVLGPTGEDPMFVYIEKLVEKAYECRNGSNIADIEFLTEIPRKRVLKKGQPLGRQCLYREFDILEVEDAVSIKNTRELKQEGTRTLFAEAYAAVATGTARGAGSVQLEHGAIIPDNTFITNMGGSNAGPARNPYNNTEAINKTDALADSLMRQVAEEMGLVTSADLVALRRKAHLPPTAADRASKLFGDDEPQVAHDLFKHLEISDPSLVPAQPVALKAAMSALRTALKQPLTDYDEVYDSKQYTRGTRNSKNSQLPKHAFELSAQITGQGPGTNTMDRDYAVDRTVNKYNKGGLPEPTLLKRLRKESRQVTLKRIDQVLGDLNAHTEQLEQANPAGVLSVKETLKHYKNFAKPGSTSIRSLMTMVDDVAEEFQK